MSSLKLFVDDRTHPQAEGVHGSSPGSDGDETATTCDLVTALDFEMDHLQELMEHSGPESVLRQRAAHDRICLTVGLLDSAYDPIRKLLADRGFQVDNMAKPDQALELTSMVAFDLILVHVPLPGMPLSDFLDALRGQDSESGGAELFILADPDETTHAKSFLGRGANRIVELNKGTCDLEGGVADRLRVASRVNVRCSVMLYYKMNDFVSTQLCPVINLSETGMLVDTRQRIPNGHRLTFALNIPEFDAPLRGEAEVVRHVHAARDGHDGFGARIVKMDARSRENLSDFLMRELQGGSGAPQTQGEWNYAHLRNDKA